MDISIAKKRSPVRALLSDSKEKIAYNPWDGIDMGNVRVERLAPLQGYVHHT